MENGTGVIKGKQLLVGSIAVIPVDNAQLVDG
jgi:hypothetical protein